MLKVSNLHRNANSQMQPDKQIAEASNHIIKNLTPFTNLKSLFLEIAHPSWSSKSFYSVLNTLSRLPSAFESLRLRMNFLKEISPIKPLESFDKLKYLHLQLSFDSKMKDSGEFLSNLECFPALKYLNLEIFSNFYGFKNSDVIRFVSQHKSLQTLRFLT